MDEYLRKYLEDIIDYLKTFPLEEFMKNKKDLLKLREYEPGTFHELWFTKKSVKIEDIDSLTYIDKGIEEIFDKIFPPDEWKIKINSDVEENQYFVTDFVKDLKYKYVSDEEIKERDEALKKHKTIKIYGNLGDDDLNNKYFGVKNGKKRS